MLTSRIRRGLGVIAAAVVLLAAQLLVAPVAEADDDDDPLCYTTRSSGDPWYAGSSASRVYDTRFSLSVPIPAGALDDRYVPQGMAAWANWNGTGEDLLLISAYHDGDGNAEPDGASAIFGVVASGSRQGTGLGRMLIANGHVGGVAVYRGWLYVGSESAIRWYRLSTLRAELEGANTNNVRAEFDRRPSSYVVGFMGTGDGYLWAGDFDQNVSRRLNGYVQTSTATGAIEYRSATQMYAPKKTQGVTVTANNVIFSTSYGRNDRGNIWVMPRGAQSLSDGNSYCFRAPSMNQGITQLNGRVYLNFESGAYTYNRGLDDPDNPIVRVHSADTSVLTSLYTTGPAD